MIIGYCSISSLEPASWLDAQKHQLASIGAEMFYCERTSIFGRKLELERAVEAANKGDVIAVTKPYRIALSTRGVVTLIERLGLKSVGIRIVNTPVDTSTTTGRMILGSAPLWSLGVSPLRSVLWDLSFSWWRRH